MARAPRTEPVNRNRGAPSADLPRVEQVTDVKDKTCRCCGGKLHPIRKDTAEMLDYVPAHLRVRVIRRPRYGCRSCAEGVVQAPAPALHLVQLGRPRLLVAGPMHELLLSTVLASPVLFADDTTLPVLDPGRGRQPAALP